MTTQVEKLQTEEATGAPFEAVDRPGSEEQNIKAHARKSLHSALMAYTAPFRHEVLATALAETQKTMDGIEALNAMEPEVRAAWDSLDDRTKAIVGMVTRLGTVEGYISACAWTNDFWNDTMEDDEAIERGCRVLADDPAGKVFCQAHELVRRLESFEKGTTTPTETVLEDAEDSRTTRITPAMLASLSFSAIRQADAADRERIGDIDGAESEDEDLSEENRLQLSKARGFMRHVVDYLQGAPIETRIATVLVARLLIGDVQANLQRMGLYDGQIGDDVLADWQDEVRDLLGDHDTVTLAAHADAAMAGLVAGLEAITA